MTRRSGRSEISARAIAPEPVPTSCTRAPSGSSVPTSTSSSVSRRGHSTRGSTRDLELAEGGAAEDVGQRLVVGAPRHRRLDRLDHLGRELAGAVARELLDADPERVGDERLGVGARLLAARRGDRLGRGLEQRADGRRDRSSLAAGLHWSTPLSFSVYLKLIRARLADIRTAPLQAAGRGFAAVEPSGRDSVPCRRLTTYIQTTPATIIATLSS